MLPLEKRTCYVFVFLQAIDEFISASQNATKGEQQLFEGEWQMIWSSQVGFSHLLSNKTIKRSKFFIFVCLKSHIC